MIAKFDYGDPEPPRNMVLIDRHDDLWSYSEDENAWTTDETAPFVWKDMRRTWFPMREWYP